MTEYLRETRRTVGGPEYVEVWTCPPPDLGVKFRVVRDEWSEDFAVRTIGEIELVGVEVEP